MSEQQAKYKAGEQKPIIWNEDLRSHVLHLSAEGDAMILLPTLLRQTADYIEQSDLQQRIEGMRIEEVGCDEGATLYCILYERVPQRAG